jgi:hypothetical protein
MVTMPLSLISLESRNCALKLKVARRRACLSEEVLVILRMSAWIHESFRNLSYGYCLSISRTEHSIGPN